MQLANLFRPEAYRAKLRQWKFIPEERLDLETSYETMFSPHAGTHRGVADEMRAFRDSEGLSHKVLEVACGAGLNIGSFTVNEFDYYGFDLSETAIQLAMKRYPRGKFFNAPAADLSLFHDNAFDLVYCSSMLEHVGEPKAIIDQMVRVAGKHLFIMFYEGLGAEDRPEFHPQSSFPTSPFGEKFVDYQRGMGGWFINRYSLRTVEEFFAELPGVRIEVLDRSNRAYISGPESIVHMRRT